MSPEVKQAYEMAARIMENEYRAQAPSKKIANGTTVIPVFNGDEVDFLVDLDSQVRYGIYLDMGTGKYRTDVEGKYNANPGKGTKGIRPRFWISLSDAAQVRIDMIIEEALDKQIEEELNKQFDDNTI
jgi:hypothetical protein